MTVITTSALHHITHVCRCIDTSFSLFLHIFAVEDEECDKNNTADCYRRTEDGTIK